MLVKPRFLTPLNDLWPWMGAELRRWLQSTAFWICLFFEVIIICIVCWLIVYQRAKLQLNSGAPLNAKILTAVGQNSVSLAPTLIAILSIMIGATDFPSRFATRLFSAHRTQTEFAFVKCVSLIVMALIFWLAAMIVFVVVMSFMLSIYQLSMTFDLSFWKWVGSWCIVMIGVALWSAGLAAIGRSPLIGYILYFFLLPIQAGLEQISDFNYLAEKILPASNQAAISSPALEVLKGVPYWQSVGVFLAWSIGTYILAWIILTIWPHTPRWVMKFRRNHMKSQPQS